MNKPTTRSTDRSISFFFFVGESLNQFLLFYSFDFCETTMNTQHGHSGTTVAVVVVVDRALYVADVGDSCVVLCRRRRALVRIRFIESIDRSSFRVRSCLSYSKKTRYIKSPTALTTTAAVAQALRVVAARAEARARSRRVTGKPNPAALSCEYVLVCF